jgi:hypothetical protein
MNRFLTFVAALLLAVTASAQRSPRAVDSVAALVAITPSALQPDVLVVSTNTNTRIQFRYYPNSSDSVSTNTSPFVYTTSIGTGRWKEVLLTGTIKDGLTTADATTDLGVANKRMVDAVTAAVAALPNPFPMSAAGLVLTVGAGNLTDGLGNPIAVSAGTVRLRASVTNIVVVDLYDKSFHAFDRNWHAAAVTVGTVVTDATGVVSIKLVQLRLCE